VTANIEIQNLKNEIDQLKLSKLERSKQGNSEKATADIQYSEAKRELDILLQLQKRTGVVESQYQGRVIEIKAGVGMLVGQGEPIITVERTNLENQISTIEAIIYVPVGEGKKVRSGMVAQVVPSTIKREEHGFIFAHVSHVSDYPATPSSMKLILQNDALVRDLSGDTPPTEIKAILDTSASNIGFKWSSAKGPDIKISSGTICAAEITVSRQRPISLVIPIFKKTLGVE
jgi:HlyD family secretion protein